jgi:hypothetical protein
MNINPKLSYTEISEILASLTLNENTMSTSIKELIDCGKKLQEFGDFSSIVKNVKIFTNTRFSDNNKLNNTKDVVIKEIQKLYVKAALVYEQLKSPVIKELLNILESLEKTVNVYYKNKILLSDRG